MRTLRRYIVVILGIYLGYMGISAAAQTGSQFCVRSYEDTNGNGLLDAQNEPLLTRGVSIELLNANSIVLASALLDKSPNADAGVVCFQNLPDGEYTVLMSSAEYSATTPRSVTKTVSSGALPTVIEFGAQRVGGEVAVAVAVAESAARTSLQDLSPEQMQSLVLRVSLSTVGAVVVSLVMLFIGFMIYMLRLRDSGPRPIAYSAASVQPPPVDSSVFERPTSFMDEPTTSLDDTSEIQPPRLD